MSAFVTLKKAGQLRGCIGYIEPHAPLIEAVADNAQSAALRDPRFAPVTPEELPDISIEVSALTPLEPVADVEEIEIGRHGLVISQGPNHGLLLPQVPVEWGWDREEFLEHTCLKAGLLRGGSVLRERTGALITLTHHNILDSMMKRSIALLLFAALIAVPCLAGELPATSTLSMMQLLDHTADFSFAIMSDHKGSAPSNSPEMARMVQWIRESRDRFVIGLGDHLCKHFGNPFLDFLATNRWWHDNFYPNIADGENEFYGTGQGDWGAGGRLLDVMGISSRAAVTVRENGCEYYARIPVGRFTVHLIQLHYPDQPWDVTVSFNEATRQYLINTLESITKDPTDIIIACAHSRFGYWIQELSPTRQQKVLDKCDLVLSATTHAYGRYAVPGYETHGALCLNTGSVCYSLGGTKGGYIEVHVYGATGQMVVQYVNVEVGQRLPGPPGTKGYLKQIGGAIYELSPAPIHTPALP